MNTAPLPRSAFEGLVAGQDVTFTFANGSTVRGIISPCRTPGRMGIHRWVNTRSEFTKCTSSMPLAAVAITVNEGA